MKKISGRYLLVLIGMCGLIASSVGLTTNVAGLFLTPVAEEFGILKGSVSLTITICNLVFAIGGMVAPKVINEKSIKKLLIIGTAVIAGSTALLGVSTGIMMMYILNALRGFAGGILGFVLITTVINNWFHTNVALATSIAMSCSGLAGALFSPIISGIIESTGWRTGYMIVAIIMVILNLPAILFLPSLDPKTKNMEPLGEKAAEGATVASEEKTESPKVNGTLLVMAALYSFLACGATALPQHFPGIAGSYAMSATVGAMMLSVCMIANSLGKIVLGALMDRIGTKPSVLLFSALVIASVVFIMLIHIPVSMYVGAALFGLSYALATVAVVMLTKDLFGMENYGKTYPTISLCGTIANALFSSLIGFMYDFSQSYSLTLIVILIMLAINIFIILTAYRSKAA